jgi:serine/threonine protein kinase
LQWLSLAHVNELGIFPCRGLDGIVHLDLKPDNVMLDENCAPRIVDLGISKMLCDEEGREMTFKGFHLKHGSRAPEYSGRSNSDLHGVRLSADMAKASDLWSLGVVLLTAFHGGDVFWHYRKATGSVFEWNIDLLASMLGRPSERALKKVRYHIYSTAHHL